MDIIDTLLDIEQQLTTWLFSTTAVTPEDQASMAKVFALKDKVSQQTNQIVLARLQIAQLDLGKQTTELNALSAKIEATASNIKLVNTIFDSASSVVGIAASIIALIA